jgi:hypothetical protein
VYECWWRHIDECGQRNIVEYLQHSKDIGRQEEKLVSLLFGAADKTDNVVYGYMIIWLYDYMIIWLYDYMII